MTWQLYQGDVLEILKQLKSEPVHCYVTSGVRFWLQGKTLLLLYNVERRVSR